MIKSTISDNGDTLINENDSNSIPNNDLVRIFFLNLTKKKTFILLD